MLVRMKTIGVGLILVVLLEQNCAFGEEPSTHIHLSKIYNIEALYESMRGPQSIDSLLLQKFEQPELLWITGYKAVMTAQDGVTPMSQEFMCHSNLDIDIENHIKLFGWKKSASRRLFTLSQGQLDIDFPSGFGIPVMSNEELSLATQALNLNDGNIGIRVRHKVSIDYVLRVIKIIDGFSPDFDHIT